MLAFNTVSGMRMICDFKKVVVTTICKFWTKIMSVKGISMIDKNKYLPFQKQKLNKDKIEEKKTIKFFLF